MKAPGDRPTQYAMLARELARLRRHAGISQEALAAQLGVNEDAVRRAEAGSRRIDVLELQSWAFACGATLTEVMTALDDRVRDVRAH